MSLQTDRRVAYAYAVALAVHGVCRLGRGELDEAIRSLRLAELVCERAMLFS